MIIIRLDRRGAKKNAFYRIIAVEKTTKKGGRPVDILGIWHPRNKVLEIKRQKLDGWIAKGAQISQTVATLIK